MGNFSKTFDRYVAEDPRKLLDPISDKHFVRSTATTRNPPRTDSARGRAGMKADSLTRILENAEGSLIASGRVEAALTKLARELIRDPKDGVKTLKRWSKKAKSDPYKALAALSTFGEVLKRAVALLERIPEKFGRLIAELRKCVEVVGQELGASNVSVTIDLPRSIAIGFSWSVAQPVPPTSATAV
ncbi:MAG TPA: hypothetical protein VEJ87_08975 [Acidimicrobiales bacterium]|nr:hypothetical protein [Acidimicrobiales bacterium]